MAVGRLTRRSLLRGLVLTATAAGAGYAAARAGGVAPPGDGGTGYGARTAASDRPGAVGHGDASAGRLLVRLDALPDGGGVVLPGPRVVVTHGPGGVRAFSATCTHRGCTVGAVQAGVIVCPCHGSWFDAGTGAVLAGPATRPLPPLPVVVRDGNVYLE
jgi:Rieske Fe-S protein